MGKSSKWLILAALAVAFVVLGYLRDFLFINLNYHLYHIQNATPTSDAHSFFDFLHNYSFWQIYSAKYALTAAFTAANFTLGYLLLKTLFGKSALLRWYTLVYVIVLTGAGLFFAGGYAVGNPNGGYYFSRILMGFLQSPVPSAILALGFPLYLQSRNA